MEISEKINELKKKIQREPENKSLQLELKRWETKRKSEEESGLLPSGPEESNPTGMSEEEVKLEIAKIERLLEHDNGNEKLRETLDYYKSKLPRSMLNPYIEAEKILTILERNFERNFTEKVQIEFEEHLDRIERIEPESPSAEYYRKVLEEIIGRFKRKASRLNEMPWDTWENKPKPEEIKYVLTGGKYGYVEF